MRTLPRIQVTAVATVRLSRALNCPSGKAGSRWAGSRWRRTLVCRHTCCRPRSPPVTMRRHWVTFQVRCQYGIFFSVKWTHWQIYLTLFWCCKNVKWPNILSSRCEHHFYIFQKRSFRRGFIIQLRLKSTSSSIWIAISTRPGDRGTRVQATLPHSFTAGKGYSNQCDQIWRFIGLWATF